MRGTPSGRPRFGRRASVAFAVAVGLALLGALFPWFPGEQQLEAGITAPRTVRAPRDLTYDSVVLTADAAERRAAAVEPVLVLDPGVRRAQLATLDTQLRAIERIRTDDALSASARETALREVPGVSLSARAAAVIAAATDEEWEVLTGELRSALNRTLAGAVNADQRSEARQRVRALFSPALSSDQTLALGELADPLVVPTQVVDEARTAAQREAARRSQPAVRVVVARGEAVVVAGQRLTAADVEKLDMLGLREGGIEPEKLAATALFAVLVGAAYGGYLYVAQPPAMAGVRRRLLFALLLIIPALAVKFAFPALLPDEGRHYLAYALPVAAAPIAVAVLLDVTGALLLAGALASVAAFVAAYEPDVAREGGVAQAESARAWLAVGAGSLAGVYVAATADRLQRFLVAGLASALALAAALAVFWLLDTDRRSAELLWLTGSAATGGVLSALISVGMFVLLSRPFGIVTRVELMELAQLNHPLLRRLQDEAPGTFQHSIVVGNLAERAADRIGADPLLVRIGAYYHDVGKLIAPEFFVENQLGERNPHEGLDPLQSTRVIHQHVSGGIELARREGLPEAVVQFIPQHHGTRLVSFFYRRAAELDEEVDPELFRYPGPRPQTREAALVMLADASEASVRAASDHSAERIAEIVDETIRERVEEGQFDECDISLRDLRVAAEAFTATLTAVYHPRVEYPAPTRRELEGRTATAGGRTPRPQPVLPAPTAPPPLRQPELTEDDA